ncbi:MAG: hypothetical protein WC050_04595, partial [Candidatus Paceibacterota bacterium]
TPQQGAYIQPNMQMPISSFYPYPSNIRQITYYLNDAPIGSATQPPYAITYVPTNRGPSILKAVAETTTGAQETQVISITMQ